MIISSQKAVGLTRLYRKHWTDCAEVVSGKRTLPSLGKVLELDADDGTCHRIHNSGGEYSYVSFPFPSADVMESIAAARELRAYVSGSVVEAQTPRNDRRRVSPRRRCNRRRFLKERGKFFARRARSRKAARTHV